ncbi:hypothetical protein LMG22037_06337 [Paraburkholderia phenoliruptrix]|jgi:hypothetical protein|uniref:Uncharacterized protein n=1 Tax=Paraburkholderia phenoliruptrix TaxID=252970 RepID=A0A6J5CL74_9BURK|nr:DUF3717 domain-containing protein [Paraburkholderia phenoliruptrix]CAB3739883.1 hypothetical protein LMG22037_06337 [Paraburkholderia phenoliruptrix]
MHTQDTAVVDEDGFGVDEVCAAIAYWMELEPCTDGFSLSQTVSRLADVYGDMIARKVAFVAKQRVPEETQRYLRQAMAKAR